MLSMLAKRMPVVAANSGVLSLAKQTRTAGRMPTAGWLPSHRPLVVKAAAAGSQGVPVQRTQQNSQSKPARQSQQQRRVAPVQRNSSLMLGNDVYPFRGLGRLSRFAQDIEDELDAMLRYANPDRTLQGTSGTNGTVGMPSTNSGVMPLQLDLKDTDKEIVVKADVPGMDKDNVQVRISADKVLTISAEHAEEHKEEREGFQRLERRVGSFSRRIQLPEDADVDKVTAKTNNGVLEVVIPKHEQQDATREVPVQ